MRPMLRLLLVALLSLGVLGCGQTGPLTLPEDPASTEDESDDEENER